MAEVRPFKGIRYSGRDDEFLARVLAPPYDVITPEQQKSLYERDPHNIVRLILGLDAEGDDERSNRYSRAADFYRSWREEGILRQDDKAAVYAYEQEYSLPTGRRQSRRGIIAAVRLVDFSRGIVLPHEQTFARHKEDRLRLMRPCRANFSPVFGLYSQPEGSISAILGRTTATAPLAFAAVDGETHRLWALTGEADLETIVAAMRERSIFIADGHHRYETALNYSRERRRELGLGEEEGSYPFDYVMMVLVEVSDPGLVILPTHRIVNRAVPAPEGELERFFRLSRLPGATPEKVLAALAEAGKEGPSFVLRTADREPLLLTLRPEAGAEALSCLPETLASLDVTVLHEIILRRLMGVDDTDPAAISFTIDPGEALGAPTSGKAAASVLLNPTRVEQVCQVALAGERMPRKSTYFYPKLITGLVINSLQ